MDRHIQELQRFLLEDIEDRIAEIRESLAADLAEGRASSARDHQKWLDRLLDTRARWRAEWGADAAAGKH